MKNLLRAWEKGAHSQSLSIKEQAMLAAESTDEFELSDAQLKAANGGCGQFGNEGYGYGQPYGQYCPEGGYAYYPHHYRHHYHCGDDGYDRGGYDRGGYDNYSPYHCRPNFEWR